MLQFETFCSLTSIHVLGHTLSKIPSLLYFRCQAMERLVQLVIQEDDMDTEVISLLGSCLCAVLKEQLEGKVFPEEVNDE